MAIQVQQFPVLTPGQMNPFNQAFQSGLDAIMNVTKAAYSPMKMYADIMSKSAYAAYTPALTAAKIFNDPALFYSLTPSQQAAVRQLAGNIPRTPLDIYNRQQPSGGGQEETSQGATPVSTQAPQQPSTSSTSSSYSGGDYGESNRASDQEVNKIANKAEQSLSDESTGSAPTQESDQSQIGSKTRRKGDEISYPTYVKSIDLTDPRMNMFKQDTGSAVGNARLARAYPSPFQISWANQNEQNQKDQNSLWKKRIAEESKGVDAREEAFEGLEAMKQDYKDLGKYEKGFLFGNLRGVSDKAQSFDQKAMKVALANTREWQKGHVTNTDVLFGNSIKPSRALNDKSFEDMVAYHEALALRDKQRQKFYKDAYARNIPLQDADTIWSDFIKNYKIYDPHTRSLVTVNSKISPFSPSQGKKIPDVTNETSSTKYVPKVEVDLRTNTAHITDPNNEVHIVPLKNVSQALERFAAG